MIVPQPPTTFSLVEIENRAFTTDRIFPVAPSAI
jgi:hypothetical protein